jgi:hypothetical protein
MEEVPKISCLRFGLLFVLATSFLPGSFGFERGDRYFAIRLLASANVLESFILA